MPEPHLEICKDCDNPMDNCRCEDWMAEDDASTPAASPVAGVSAINFWAVVVDGRRIWCGFNEDECESVAQSRGGTVVPYVAQPSAEGDGWVAVSERLPESIGDYLVVGMYGNARWMDVKTFVDGEFKGCHNGDRATHWWKIPDFPPLLSAPVAKEGRES